MKNKLNILILEDVATDAELIERELRKEKIAFSSKRVDTKTDFLRELKDFNPDLILSDYMLPQFDGMTALGLVKERAPSIPFILVTGSMNEETAVECMKAGAADYVIKEHLARIGPAVSAALENKQTREEKEKAEKALMLSAQEWQTTFNTMSDGICLIDEERKIRRVNQSMTNILKKPLIEIIGHECNILLHGKSKPIKDCPHMRMRKSKKREIFYFQKGEHWYNCAVDPNLDKTGNLIGAVLCLSDITEIKKAEKKLQEERNLLQTLIDNVPDLIYIKDVKSRFIIGNMAVVDLMRSKTPEELIGKTDFDFYPHEMAKQYYTDEQEIIQKGQPIINKEETNIDASGNQRWLLTTKIPFLDNNDNTIGVIGIGRDITEHKRADEKIESLARFPSEDPFPVLRVMKDGTLLYANDASLPFLKNWGCEVGQSITDHLHRLILDVIKSNKRKIIEIKLKDQIFLFVFTPVKEAGYVNLYGTDITERKVAEEALRESEEFLNAIVENIPNMIFVKDAKELRYIRFNKAGEELLGYSRKELIGKTDYDFFTKDEAEYFINKDREALKKEKLEDIPEEIIQTKHLGKRILHTKKIPIRDKQRKPLYLLGISEDITEHKNLEEQFFQAQKMEAIGRLTGGIAHDFNNILTVIIGFSDILLMKLDKKDFSYTYLKEISKAGKRAASLTHQLLAFSRKQILQPSVLNINIMISDMDKMLHRIIGEDIDLVTNLEPDLGNMNIDPSQIEQVIMNLAVNAKDAMSQGGKLTIETANVYLDEEYARQHITVEPGHYVMLAVSDNGIGMDEETQVKIFEPFFSTKEKDKGTGLGLSTVYGIVKQSGGFVWVYSEPGKGTSFKIYFPRVVEKIGLKKATEPHIQSIQGTEAILVVEDDDLVREVVANSLTTLGYSILEAKNGEDALRYFKKERKQSIDLIVTDIVMPQMSGGEFIKQLRKKDNNTKVLFISGYTDNAVVHHGILDEGIPYLQKPFTMNDLGKKVREVLDSG